MSPATYTAAMPVLCALVAALLGEKVWAALLPLVGAAATSDEPREALALIADATAVIWRKPVPAIVEPLRELAASLRRPLLDLASDDDSGAPEGGDVLARGEDPACPACEEPLCPPFVACEACGWEPAGMFDASAPPSCLAGGVATAGGEVS